MTETTTESPKMDLIRPDRPSRCTWTPTAGKSPHTKRTDQIDRHQILPDILHAIGVTPLVKLNKIPQLYGLKCELYAKCEFFNPGGSVKDRIAYRMIQDAEANGTLKPGATIIEPTSGNTGIGLAMCAAVRGYKCIIVMPEKMSNEKVYALQALGAEIVRTPTEAAWDSPEAHITVSQQLQKQIPNSIVLDQYTNAGNPLAHYDQTAAEILQQMDGKVDYLVAGAGTGGTISGIGRKFKEASPATQIVAVDPKGSILAHPHHLNEHDVTYYEVEGIGYDFVPTVLDRGVVDMWVKTDDKESLNAARQLIREEGLLCGGSSGAALSAALKVAKDLPAGKRVVVLLPDGIRNYMTKFVSDHWMEARGFKAPPEPIDANKWWWNVPVSSLTLHQPATINKKGKKIEDALQKIQEFELQELVVTDNNGFPEGIIIPNLMMSRLIAGSIKRTDSIEKAMNKQFYKVDSPTGLGLVSRILEKEPFGIVMRPENDDVVGIVRHADILNYISTTNGSACLNNHSA